MHSLQHESPSYWFRLLCAQLKALSPNLDSERPNFEEKGRSSNEILEIWPYRRLRGAAQLRSPLTGASVFVACMYPPVVGLAKYHNPLGFGLPKLSMQRTSRSKPQSQTSLYISHLRRLGPEPSRIGLPWDGSATPPSMAMCCGGRGRVVWTQA
jgi:hypothetical protein